MYPVYRRNESYARDSTLAELAHSPTPRSEMEPSGNTMTYATSQENAGKSLVETTKTQFGTAGEKGDEELMSNVPSAPEASLRGREQSASVNTAIIGTRSTPLVRNRANSTDKFHSTSPMNGHSETGESSTISVSNEQSDTTAKKETGTSAEMSPEGIGNIQAKELNVTSTAPSIIEGKRIKDKTTTEAEKKSYHSTLQSPETTTPFQTLMRGVKNGRQSYATTTVKTIPREKTEASRSTTVTMNRITNPASVAINNINETKAQTSRGREAENEIKKSMESQLLSLLDRLAKEYQKKEEKD